MDCLHCIVHPATHGPEIKGQKMTDSAGPAAVGAIINQLACPSKTKWSYFLLSDPVFRG
jgi:hypothetical protein